MALGNPDNAVTDPASRTKYLIQRSQYALSYNDDTRQANWVSWSYSRGDVGADVARTDAFAADTDLPLGFLRVGPDSFGSVYDRGHLCPSEDRVFSTPDNQITFRMSNIIPQAYANNRGLWSSFEEYCRGLATNSAVVSLDNEVLITAGPVVNSSAPAIFNGMKIPDSVWKVAVVIPGATNAISAATRITTSCRVIGILVPNRSDNLAESWTNYIVSVEEIEAVTGLEFFKNVDAPTAVYLKNVVDTGTGPNSPTVVTGFLPISGTPGTTVTLSGFNFGTSPLVDFGGVEVNGTPVPGNPNQITAVVPEGASTGSIAVTGTGGTDQSYGTFTVFTGLEPLYSLSTPALADFTSTAGKNGAAKNYSVSGSNLSGDITVQATAPFEVALSNSGPFSSTLTIPTGSGTISGYPIWVRIGTAGLEGAVSGSITHTGGNAPSQTLAVSGTVASGAPKLTLSAATLGGLFASQGKAGISKAYFISGVNLSNPVTVSVASSTNFQVSGDNLTFGSSQTLQPVNEGLSNVPVYVRISSNAAAGAVSGTVSHTGSGLPATNLALMGTVTAKQYLAAWDFYGESNSATSSADLFDAFLDSANSLSRGTNAGRNSATDSFRTTGFKNDGIAITNSDYFEFSLSVVEGKTLSITSVVVKFVGTSTFYASPGVTNQFAFSTNGTNFVLIDSPVVVTAINTPINFNFSGVSELQNLPANTTATFRYYASGQTSSGGWGFGSSATGNYGLAVEGTVNSLAPVITSPLAASGIARTAFSYAMTADNLPSYFAASGLPDGISIDPSTGIITGLPLAGGTYTVQLTAGNDGGDGTASLVLTIVDPTIGLSANSLTGLTSIVGAAGSTRTYTLSGSDLSGPITLNASTGFEVSTDNNTFASTLSLTPLNGVLTAQTLSVRMSSQASNGVNFGTITHSGGGAVSRTLELSGTAFQPEIQLSTNAIAGLSSISGAASGLRSYSVSGSYLAEAVSVMLPPDSKFEISADGSTFSSSLMLLPVGSSLDGQAIQVRLKASAPEGAYTETITHSGGGANSQTLTLSGTVAKPPASLTLSPASLGGFSSVAGSAGTSQSYLLSGSGLTNVIRISPSFGFEVSTNGTSFESNLTVSPISGSVSNRTIHVRLASNATVGAVTGAVAHSSLGALPLNLSVAGAVTNSSRPFLTSFLFGAVYTNSSFSHTITATNLSGTSSITYGASNLPAGWTVNTNTGVINGSSSGSASTNLTFTVWAANTNGTHSATYRLRVLTQADQNAIPLNVVINKYLDDSTNGDRVELLVTGDASGDPPVDLRGIVLKDFSINMGSDGGGKYLFNDHPLWASVKAGTLVILSAGTRYPEDLDGADFKISINLGNTVYLRHLGGAFNIGSTDMVMIKGAESGPDGVAGGIHALSAGNSGSQYTAFKGKKMNINNSRAVAYAKNSSSALADFYASSGAASASTLTFGIGNTPANRTFISNLQALDQQGPTVTLLGSNPMAIALGGSYIEPGATAMDSKDGARTVAISGTVNAAVVGAYPITYSASDIAGNIGTAIRTVTVVDQTPPLLTLSGSSSVQLPLGQAFVDPGAYATDDWDGPVPYTVSGGVNTEAAGTYVLVYSALDTSGNTAPELIRTVQVSSPLQSWAEGFGLIGANSEPGLDFDGDGLPNLAEYALQGDPTRGSGSQLPVLTQTNVGGTNWLRFAYRARTNDPGLLIQPVFKENLAETNWSTNGLIQKVSGVAVGDGEHEDQVWQTPVEGVSRKFLKLLISR